MPETGEAEEKTGSDLHRTPDKSDDSVKRESTVRVSQEASREWVDDGSPRRFGEVHSATLKAEEHSADDYTIRIIQTILQSFVSSTLES